MIGEGVFSAQPEGAFFQLPHQIEGQSCLEEYAVGKRFRAEALLELDDALMG